MVASLEEAKREVRGRLLGSAGVHAVGLRRAENAVAVYVDADALDRLRELVPAVKGAIAPYDVVLIPQARASITSS